MVRIKHKLKDAVILFILPEQIFAGFSHFAVGFHVLILRYNVQKLLFLLWHMVDSFKGFCLSGDVTAICTALLQAAEEFGISVYTSQKRLERIRKKLKKGLSKE